MSASVWTEGYDLNSVADRILNVATRFWFLIAVGGQWMFAYYVAAFYGGAAVRGDLQAWNKVMPHGYVPPTRRNIAIAAHLFGVCSSWGRPALIPHIRATLRQAIADSASNTPCASPALPSLHDLVRTMRRLRHTWGHARCDPDHGLRSAGLALRDGRPDPDASPLGPAPVHGGQCSLVLPGRTDVLDRRQPGPCRFRSQDVQGPVSQLLGLRRLPPAAAVLELYFRTRYRAGATGRFAMAGGCSWLPSRWELGSSWPMKACAAGGFSRRSAVGGRQWTPPSRS